MRIAQSKIGANPAMRTANTERLVRRNIQLPDSYVRRVAAMRKKSDAASDSEVIRRALRLYEAVFDDSVELRIVDKKTGKEKQLVIA